MTKSIEIPEPVFTFEVETGRWRTEGNVPLTNWEGILYVMGNPVLRRTFLDRYDADNYPEIAAEYDDTASNRDDAEEKFGVTVAETFKAMFANMGLTVPA